MMTCKDCAGSGICGYRIMLPYYVHYVGAEPSETKMVVIDKCLLGEVVGLWELGIKTTGCCCGHGDAERAYIGCMPGYESRMEAQGNKPLPEVRRAYMPHTQIHYGEADKGFNWRRRGPVPIEAGDIIEYGWLEGVGLPAMSQRVQSLVQESPHQPGRLMVRIPYKGSWYQTTLDNLQRRIGGYMPDVIPITVISKGGGGNGSPKGQAYDGGGKAGSGESAEEAAGGGYPPAQKEAAES